MAKPAKWDSMTPSEQEAWREKQREHVRKWRKDNHEKHLESKRKRYEANPEKQREQNRKWREANPEKERESRREQYAANSEKVRESNRKWSEANPEKRREINLKSYYKTRQQTAADQFFILAGAAESISKIKLKSESK